MAMESNSLPSEGPALASTCATVSVVAVPSPHAASGAFRRFCFNVHTPAFQDASEKVAVVCATPSASEIAAFLKMTGGGLVALASPCNARCGTVFSAAAAQVHAPLKFAWARAFSFVSVIGAVSANFLRAPGAKSVLASGLANA